VDHPEAGVGVRRGQVLAAAVVVLALLGAAAYADREIGPRALGTSDVPPAPSGVWFCPHGGGPSDWQVFLQVANPGERPATIRVRTLGSKRPLEPRTLTVEPSSFVRVPVPADGRERASMVEWFDQWVAVGWIAHAGGGERGVAAEPCAAAAGDRWLLPDGTTETEDNQDYVVVMNPFARAAVVSVVLYSERNDPVVFGKLTDIELGPYRSRAIKLNVVKGERTVSALVEASVGRVAAATLGVTTTGGIRSALGYLGGAPARLTLPGGADAGRSDLEIMNTGRQRATVGAEIVDPDVTRPYAGIADSPSPPESARTFTATTSGQTSVIFTTDAAGVAVARRTYGVGPDQGSSEGAEAASAWLVLPAVADAPSNPALVLANPGTEPAQVTLSFLGSATPGVSVLVPAGRAVAAPSEFVQGAPEGAVIAVATSGTFVPAAASYSLGQKGFSAYAVALGIPIPAQWMPG
jgi:hypothetical protein